MNLERTKEILSTWEEIDYRLFVKAVNRSTVDNKSAYFMPAVAGKNDICLKMSICLNDVITSDCDIVQASAPLDYLEYLSQKTPGEILGIAFENTLNMFPPICMELTDDVFALQAFVDGDDRGVKMLLDPSVSISKPETNFIVTNASKINGATTIFLPGVKERLCEIMDSNLIIAFTSVHEAMVHPYDGTITPSQIKSILQDGIFVHDPGFLSSEVYIYDRDSKVLSVYEESEMMRMDNRHLNDSDYIFSN